MIDWVTCDKVSIMKTRLSGLLLVALLLPACKKNEMVEVQLGNEAPAFGSPAKTLGEFAIGRWEYVGVGGAQKMGTMGAVPATDILEFKADKTFVFQRGGFKLGGTWQDTGQSLSLAYTLLNDKPYQEEMAAFQKRAEGGTQGAVKDELFLDWATQNLGKMMVVSLDEGQKSLFFGEPAPPVQTGNPDMDALAADLSRSFRGLERLGKKPAQ